MAVVKQSLFNHIKMSGSFKTLSPQFQVLLLAITFAAGRN